MERNQATSEFKSFNINLCYCLGMASTADTAGNGRLKNMCLECCWQPFNNTMAFFRVVLRKMPFFIPKIGAWEMETSAKVRKTNHCGNKWWP